MNRTSAYIKWRFLSGMANFFYWLNQKAGQIWGVVALDQPSCWFDAVPAFFLRGYYKYLNRCVSGTGRNLYGNKV